MSLEQLASDYGAIGLFAGAGLEGETVAMLGGVLAHRGLVEFWVAVFAVASGSFLVDQAFFLAARCFRNHPRVHALQEGPAGARVLRIASRRPDAFVFGFRFLYGLRIASAVTIGTTSYPLPRFIMLNALAALIWATVFVALGYVCGQAIAGVFGRLEAHLHYPLALAVIIGVAILIAHQVSKTRRRPS